MKTGGSSRLSSNIISIVAFFVSCAFLAFLLGTAVGAYQLFPFKILKSAKDAFDGIFMTSQERPHYLLPNRYRRSGVRLTEGHTMAPGITLLTSYWQIFDWKPGVLLIDAEGGILHSWEIDPAKIWPESPYDDHVAGVMNTASNFVHGTHLFDNGDLLFNVEYMGLARMNAKGQVLWRLSHRTHHSISRDEDGSFWVCAARWLEKEDPRLAMFPGLSPPLVEDYALKVSPEGEVLQEVSLLEALYASGNQRMLWKYGSGRTGDVLHLNDVEALPRAVAGAYPLFQAGDIVVSLKFIHTVMVIEPETGQVRWMVSDPFIAQHDPDFTGDGWIRVFDNNVDESDDGQWLGGSRIVAVEPHTGKVKIIYPAKESGEFYTPAGGKVQTLPGGNLLITEAQAGRVFEVDATGRTVWEWIHQAYKETDLIPEVLEGSRYLLTEEEVASWARN